MDYRLILEDHVESLVCYYNGSPDNHYRLTDLDSTNFDTEIVLEDGDTLGS